MRASILYAADHCAEVIRDGVAARADPQKFWAALFLLYPDASDRDEGIDAQLFLVEDAQRVRIRERKRDWNEFWVENLYTGGHISYVAVRFHRAGNVEHQLRDCLPSHRFDRLKAAGYMERGNGELCPARRYRLHLPPLARPER